MTDDEVANLLARADSRALHDIRRTLIALPRTRAIVPALAAAFGHTRQAMGRAALLHLATPYARFDDAAIELGVRALDDRASDVRHRAYGLLGHGRRAGLLPLLHQRATGRSGALAQQAITAITSDRPFAGDDDAFWFFDPTERYRLPRGAFADQVERDAGSWLRARAFEPEFLFAHGFVYRAGDATLSAEWDAYEVGAQVQFRTPQGLKAERWIEGLDPEFIGRVGKAIRTLVGE